MQGNWDILRCRVFSIPRRLFLRPGLLATLGAFLLLQACFATPTPTPFVAPKAAPPTGLALLGQQPVIPTFTPPAEPTVSPTPTPPCANDLDFLDDLTIPDGTVVSPGVSIDKQWLVQNSGSCNWDARYRLKFAGGDPLGATTEQALYPARAGMQVTLRISFTAPTTPGTYKTAWQAFDPQGEAFGDAIFMEIVVAQ
ncbi:MAG: hypothetical protein Fur0043_28620 [Anaerolineales bacterium]